MAADAEAKIANSKPRIAIPEPCSYDRAYSGRALPPYIQAVEACGGEPVLIPLGLPPEEIARLITGCSAILLPGSKADVDPQKYGAKRDTETADADPLRDSADELLLQDAYNLRKPIFGICYGLQSLNVWRTGTLIQHINSAVTHSAKRGDEFAHAVQVEPESRLAHHIGENSSPTLPVNSTHHQAAEIVGDGLRVSARCPDDGVIEAIEGTIPGHFVIAVQWHPERSFTGDEASQRLFESFIRAASRWRESR